jgi:hypothetical protein
MAKSLQIRSAVKTAPVVSDLDKVLAAFAAKPVQTVSPLHKMVREVAAKQGVDYDSMTAGQKAAFTRRVAAAVKASGIKL